MSLALLLRTLGGLLWLGSRLSARMQAQISRRTIIEIRSEDGAARHFIFDKRRVSSRAGRAEQADAAIVFSSAAQGVRSLLTPRTLRLLVDGVLDHSITLEGNIYLLLWFYGLVLMVFPIARPPRLPATPPRPYIAHNPNALAADRITRLPVAHELDPQWTDAATARAKLLMIRVDSGGEEPPPF